MSKVEIHMESKTLVREGERHGPASSTAPAATAAGATGGHPIKGLHIERHYTKPGIEAYADVQWTTRKSVIKEPDGTIVFAVDRCEVPKEWSQLATDIIVS